MARLSLSYISMNCDQAHRPDALVHQTKRLSLFWAAFLTSGTLAAADLPAVADTKQAHLATGPIDAECPPVRCPPSPDAIYEMRLKERARRRHEAALVQLTRVIQLEGPNFSPERFRHYRIQQTTGIALISVGAAGAVTSVFLLAAAFVQGFDADPEIDPNNEYKSIHALKTGGLSLLAASTVALSAGAPLFALGHKGIKRQRILLRKQEIQQSLSLGVDFGRQVDRKRNYLGLSIGARF